MTYGRFITLCAALVFASPSAQAEMGGPPSSRAMLNFSFAPIVKKAVPAVVNVYSTRIVQNPLAGYFDDPLFRRFMEQQGLGGQRKERVQSSLGSGVIVSPEGLVITNHHVIAKADEVKVALSDQREFEATVVLRDERTDLAVLKLNTHGETFPTLELADSDAVDVGDLVLAIGNPFGVGQTVTSGIVSALARTQVGVADYQFFIQTDAAINPGNSGGALLDISGKLLGINTAIYSRSGGSIGIGFAIPATMVRVVIDSARAGSAVVRRPWIGAKLQAVSAELAESLGLAKPAGVLVAGVLANSPSQQAGLRTSDVITAVDGVEVNNGDQLAFRVATKPLGSTAALTVLRQGRSFSVPLKLEPAAETRPRDLYRVSERVPLLGTSLANLSPAVADELRLDFDAEGVAVTEVADNSPAARLGVRRGDILRAVNGSEIQSTNDLRALHKTRSRVWELTLERSGKTLTVTVAG